MTATQTIWWIFSSFEPSCTYGVSTQELLRASFDAFIVFVIIGVQRPKAQELIGSSS